MAVLNLVQAYFLENCVRKFENSKVRKFSGFFEILISTSGYLGIGVYGDLADSAKVHQLERTFRGTASPIPTCISTFSGWARRKVWPTGLLDSETARPQARSRENKFGHYGVKISKSFFRLGPTSIVFSSFCRSRKVVWNQSELKNRVTFRLAILP